MKFHIVKRDNCPLWKKAAFYFAAVAAPILCAGDVLGLVLFLGEEGAAPGEAEYKLAQTVAAFLGKNMEN